MPGKILPCSTCPAAARLLFLPTLGSWFARRSEGTGVLQEQEALSARLPHEHAARRERQKTHLVLFTHLPQEFLDRVWPIIKYVNNFLTAI